MILLLIYTNLALHKMSQLYRNEISWRVSRQHKCKRMSKGYCIHIYFMVQISQSMHVTEF